ncbi:MAG: pyridoxamine 5'-phosphate oxidase family protein [Xanthobacteraceae bacterium]|jgi:nitroimidazol reductase NimA-like FMN-containing flavoprotein (pyridoxamine 5'-phosphate oxidase superfamily)
MDRDFKAEIIALLNAHQIMTIATIRRDGWPQATVVSYANDGLVLYSIIGRNTQKYLNIVRDPRVSVAISGVSAQPLQYKGLSLGGHATVVESSAQIERFRALVLSRNPQYKELPAPDPAMIAVLCVKPEVVSIVDYSKGFGHSDLVRVSQDQRVELVEAMRHHWAGLQAA